MGLMKSMTPKQLGEIGLQRTTTDLYNLFFLQTEGETAKNLSAEYKLLNLGKDMDRESFERGMAAKEEIDSKFESMYNSAKNSKEVCCEMDSNILYNLVVFKRMAAVLQGCQDVALNRNVRRARRSKSPVGITDVYRKTYMQMKELKADALDFEKINSDGLLAIIGIGDKIEECIGDKISGRLQVALDELCEMFVAKNEIDVLADIGDSIAGEDASRIMVGDHIYRNFLNPGAEDEIEERKQPTGLKPTPKQTEFKKKEQTPIEVVKSVKGATPPKDGTRALRKAIYARRAAASGRFLESYENLDGNIEAINIGDDGFVEAIYPQQDGRFVCGQVEKLLAPNITL